MGKKCFVLFVQEVLFMNYMENIYDTKTFWYISMKSTKMVLFNPEKKSFFGQKKSDAEVRKLGDVLPVRSGYATHYHEKRKEAGR